MNSKEKAASNAVLEQITSRQLQGVGFITLVCLGIAMVLFHDAFIEHNSREKVFLWLVKEVWSWQAGIGFVILFSFLAYRTFSKIMPYKDWLVYRDANGFFLFKGGKLQREWTGKEEGDIMYIFIEATREVREVNISGDWNISLAKVSENVKYPLS